MAELADTFGYSGRRVVVTGAASGIGAATTELLAGLGAEVHAIDLRPAELPAGVTGYEADLGNDQQILDVAAAIGGEVNALFNCAGIPGTFEPMQIFGVNFVGMRLLTETLLPSMPSGSAVCCVGSTSGVAWQRHMTMLGELLETPDADAARAWAEKNLEHAGYPYDFSKEAVNAYVAFRGLTTVGDGVRMTCVNPGGTKTNATPDFTKVMKAKDGGMDMLRNYPRLLGRLAAPVEQAWPMVFLNSELASFMNGTSVYVDAGLTGGLFTEQYDPAVGRGMRWEPLRS